MDNIAYVQDTFIPMDEQHGSGEVEGISTSQAKPGVML